jgi:hypothetical protein
MARFGDVLLPLGCVALVATLATPANAQSISWPYSRLNGAG